MPAEGDFEPLRPEHRADLDSRRAWVRETHPKANTPYFDSSGGKLRVVKDILDQKWIKPNELGKFQALGVVMGDAIAQAVGMEWVSVDDQHGCEPALRSEALDEKTESVFVWPMNLFSKRIERGEVFDVIDIFEQICGHVLTMRGD